MRAILALAVVASCHSARSRPGAPLAASQELIVVAHQDDDLLFMQPDLLDAIHRGGLTTVYVTAGNGKQGAAVAERRYAGVRAAYGSVAGDDAWACGQIEIAGHAAEHCRLERERISLVFLGYPDGGKQGELPASLLRLWQGDIASAAAVGIDATYTRESLIATLAAIVQATHPARVRTLDATAAHGYDHADHLVVGALALAAIGDDARPEVLAYRGYNVESEPENVAAAAHDRVFPMVARYSACAERCATCGEACKAIDPQHDTWMRRRYAVGFRNLVGGVLRAGSKCLRDDGVLGDCAGAPEWQLDGTNAPAGTVALGANDAAGSALGANQAAGSALAANHPAGSALGPNHPAGSDAAPGAKRVLAPGHRVRFDDEGHLWIATPAGRGLACLSAADRPSFGPCDPAAVWTIDARVALPSAMVYRDAPTPAVTGDLDGDGRVDSCTLGPAGPRCQLAGEQTDAPWGFALRGTVAFAPLHATLTDIDGDGRADLCTVIDDRAWCARSQGHAFGPGFEAGWIELSDAGGPP